jgi:hypothetical protein
MFRLLYKAIFRLQSKICFDTQLAVSLKRQLYIKTPFEMQPENGFIKKPKHVANIMF